MRKVNVLFLIPQMGMGGSERLVHNLIRGMDRSRFSPSLAWLNGVEPLQEFRDLQVPLHCVPKTKRVDISTMRRLAKIIQSENIDVVSAQHFMPAVYAYYGCSVATRTSLIFTAHSRWEIEDTPLKWRVAGGYLLRRIGASVGVTPDVSGAIRQVFRMKASQVVTIENGVELEVFSADRDVRELRSSLGISGGDVVIGIVANLKSVKNHLFLLQAFAKVAEDIKRVKLLVIGQGFKGEVDNTEDELRQFIDNRRLAERVLFLGYRKDIPELLKIMDVYCLTSLREGLPIGLIEAMAAGLPVVATNVEGIRDVITPHVDGLLVEVGAVPALKDSLVSLIKDPQLRRKLGKSGHDKAVQRYSLQRCIHEYQQLFFNLTKPV